MDVIQEAVERGRAILWERSRLDREAVKRRAQHIEMVKAAIHAKALELVPEAFRPFAQPVGLLSYMHYWMDYSERYYYWAEQIQIMRVFPPVVMRFEVKKLGHMGNSADDLLEDTVIEEISLAPYERHDRAFLAIAQVRVEEEVQDGWRWDYRDALGVNDSLDVALAMADELQLDPTFFEKIDAKKKAQAQEEEEGDEREPVIKTPEYYEHVEEWFNARVNSTNSEQDELLGKIGVMLTDIAMSLKMLSISAMTMEPRDE